MKKLKLTICVLILALLTQCTKSVSNLSESNASDPADGNTAVRPGAEQLEVLLPMLRNKNIALVVNHTSLVKKTHLADTLKSSGINIKKSFCS